jgi:hypothetical protein
MIPQEKGALGVGYYKTTPLFKMEGTTIFSPSLAKRVTEGIASRSASAKRGSRCASEKRHLQ